MLINSLDRLQSLQRARGEIRDHQGKMPPESFYLEKLQAIWDRARKASVYRNLGEFSLRGFRSLPVTSKTQLKVAHDEFLVTSVDAADKYYETTGTSGRPTPTPRLAEDAIWNITSVAEAWRGLLAPHERVLVMMPSDIVPVADLIVGVSEYLGFPHTRCYPFAAGISDWDRLIDVWQTLRPTTVFIAPGVILQFSRLLKQRGLLEQLRAPVAGLMLLGEVSTAPFRERLGRWWDASAFDASYGSTETGTLAASCANDQLHLLTAANYFELVTDGEVVSLPAAGTGRLVVTPLNMWARVLLRLDTEDEVTVSSGCSCGNQSPVVQVAGRSSDALQVRGTTLTVRSVEDVVYGVTEATGYLMEVDAPGRFARLILERDVHWNRDGEQKMARQVQRVSRDVLGLEWDEVLFLNQLPASTKSGASQKSWKRSNFRVVGAE